jgi:LPS-assembly protein
LVELLDPYRQVIINGIYTTCRPSDPAIPADGGDIQSASNPYWQPDWFLRARRLTIDQDINIGHAQDALVVFKGVPILVVPSMTFPIDSGRISGWLAPTFALDNQSALTFALPYYWNIAPNRDMTITPTVRTRRGVQLENEFRYLENDYQGKVGLSYMPGDQLRHRDRWSLNLQHSGSITTGLPVISQLGVGLNINRVSDNNYWQDFSENGLFNLSRILSQDGSLSWSTPGRLGDWNVNLRAQTWQVQQQDSSLIVPPYSILPELKVNWGKSAATDGEGSWDYAVEASTARFIRRLPSTLTDTQPNANRTYVNAWISRPWINSWGFVTPKVELNGISYGFSTPTSTGVTSANVIVPTASLDTGLKFERQMNVLGQEYTQTLEPRLMYVYTPYKNQSDIPLYDTGAYGFNFATIWGSNSFAGHDRISDNNTLTGGVTSHLLDSEMGSELLRFAIAQRYRFSPEKVTLPGQSITARGWSDLLLGAGINLNTRWSFEALQQYNLTTHSSTRTALNMRYSPGPLQLVNVAYSREVDLNNRFFDVGFQWPLGERSRAQLSQASNPSGMRGKACRSGSWFGVGRLNYSIVDQKVVDGILGMEYDAGCWVGRVVVERIGTTTTTATKRVIFQLELSGLARLGINPITTLRQKIPGYQPAGQPGQTPSRFTNYD